MAFPPVNRTPRRSAAEHEPSSAASRSNSAIAASRDGRQLVRRGVHDPLEPRFLRDLDPRSHVIVAAQAVATRTAANGSSRHFEAVQQFGRFWSEADIEPFPFTGYRFSLGLRQHTASCSCAIGGTRCASAASIFSRSRLMILPEMPS